MSVRDRLGRWWVYLGSLGTSLMVVFDVAVILASVVMAYYLRFDGAIPGVFKEQVWLLCVAACVVFPVLFRLFKLYQYVWRYVGIGAVLRLFGGVLLGGALLLAADLAAQPLYAVRPVPLGVLGIVCALVFIGTAALRGWSRLLVYFQSASSRGSAVNVVIVGAGDGGSLLLRDIDNQPELGLRVVGFLDDDKTKMGRLIRQVPVLGTTSDLERVLETHHVDELFIAIPSLSNEAKRRILDVCNRAAIKTRIVPGFVKETRQVGIADLRRVSVTDLLGREPVEIDVEQTADTVRGKVVLVTGAAGSIGSELCRQVLKLQPSRLILVEIDESRLYELYLELLESDPDAPRMHICDIRDERKLRDIFAAERPSLVLHAAAYKHVPLMELASDEAVKTNVVGTRNVLDACEATGVEHFVLISTDKAVMPLSVMGVTKAIAERMTLDAGRRALRTTAVRFGNVLGSRGSVVPLFEEQLRRGGPLKVTHPDVTRYFMTIPEAALLVLQAQALSDGGEVFVLEMGKPVRIVDLAQKMITLSGAHAEICFTGLRPAEKMHESLVHDYADLLPTSCSKIMQLNCLPMLPRNLEAMIRALATFARLADDAGLRELFARIIPEFAGASPEGSDGSLSAFDFEMETLF